MVKLPPIDRFPKPIQVLWSALKQWSGADAGRHGAALAYYTLFALAPMLVIVIAIAGAVYGEEAVRGEVVGQLNHLLGQDGAELVESLLKNAREGDQGVLAALLGGITFLLGATGAFVQLQGALNHIWGVTAEPGRNLQRFVINRAQSFAMLVALGFLLMVSLAIDAGLAAAAAWTSVHLSGLPVLNLINMLVSLAVVTAVFALVYRVLPDVQLRWRDVWYGALITAVLFTVGKRLIGLYLGETSMASAYGAAGSVVIVMVWVFYSAQVLLLGAAITKVGFGGEPKRRQPTAIARKEAKP